MDSNYLTTNATGHRGNKASFHPFPLTWINSCHRRRRDWRRQKIITTLVGLLLLRFTGLAGLRHLWFLFATLRASKERPRHPHSDDHAVHAFHPTLFLLLLTAHYLLALFSSVSFPPLPSALFEMEIRTSATKWFCCCCYLLPWWMKFHPKWIEIRRNRVR